MKTQKPLMQLIPDILMYFNTYREQLQFDLRLYQMHEGQIRKEVELSLAAEMMSQAAYRRAIQRIPSINVPKKVVDKLSKVYAEAPIRFTEKEPEIIEQFANQMCLNAVLGHSNRMSNLNKRCAIEIYVENGKQLARVLNAHQFLVYSDSPTSPNHETVFIKLLGQERKTRQTVARRDGQRTTTEDEITLVDIMALYTDTEVLIIDSDGSVRRDKMAEMGIQGTSNPFGVIPFVYVNKSHSDLMPYPNQTAFDMGVLIPKLLTDLNYAAQFMSHSIIWTRNADLTGSEINPDATVDLGDDNPEGGKPEMGTITPTTDIDGVLKLIGTQLGFYMTTEGLKAGSIGQMEASSAASGISKIIDESDATESRKSQTELYRKVEMEFWDKFAKMQQVWANNGLVENKTTFPPDFTESFSIKFAEIKPLESEKEKYEKMKVARDLKLITKKQALREIYPNLPEEQLESRLTELEKELEKEKEEMMDMGLTPGAMQMAEQKVGKSVEKIAEQGDNGTKPE